MKSHNHNTVFILGAGFGVDAGLPLIDNFLERLRDAIPWLEGQDRAAEAAAISKVLDFRLKAAAAASVVDLDLESVEELFSLASASEPGDRSDYVRLAIAATLDYCRSCHAHQERAVLGFHAASDGPSGVAWEEVEKPATGNVNCNAYFKVPLYGYYASVLSGLLTEQRKNSSSTVITLNYDTLVEEGLASAGIKPIYGFGAKTFADKRTVLAAEPHECIPVLKLHGSVNWAFPGTRGGRLTVYDDYSHLRRELPDGVPILLPPTWNKILIDPVNVVWQRAVKALSVATRIVVVGFSIPPTDAHFKYLLAAGLRENISIRQILFVNPDKATIQPRVERMFPNAHFRRRAIRFIDVGTREFFTDLTSLKESHLQLGPKCVLCYVVQ